MLILLVAGVVSLKAGSYGAARTGSPRAGSYGAARAGSLRAGSYEASSPRAGFAGAGFIGAGEAGSLKDVSFWTTGSGPIKTGSSWAIVACSQKAV